MFFVLSGHEGFERNATRTAAIGPCEGSGGFRVMGWELQAIFGASTARGPLQMRNAAPLGGVIRDRAYGMVLDDMSGSSLIDESVQRATAWLDSAGTAPADKFLRVDYDPNDEYPFSSFQAALRILCEFAPAVIIPGTCRSGIP